MVLGSQSGSHGAGRVFSGKAKRARFRSMLLRRLAIVGVVGLVGYYGIQWLSGDGDEETPVENPYTSTPQQGDTNPDGSLQPSPGIPGIQTNVGLSPAGSDPAGVPTGNPPASPGDLNIIPDQVVIPGTQAVGTTPLVPTSPPPGSTSPLVPQPGSTGGPVIGNGPGVSPTAHVQTDDRVTARIQLGMQQLTAGRLIEARDTLNRCLAGPISDAHHARVRQEIEKINAVLIFSPQVVPTDPLVEPYIVGSGDSLARIGKKAGTPWRFLAQVNNIKPPRYIIRPGMKMKLIKGPFHCRVYKHAFRLDLYCQSTFIRSFNVALGEYNSTPLGRFIIREDSKLENPTWVNPRTGEQFDADDPKNPLGEHWMGLRGVEPSTEIIQGYGIHGTIEPDSIGKQASMGCVRLLADDIEMLFNVLEEGVSMVEIRP